MRYSLLAILNSDVLPGSILELNFLLYLNTMEKLTETSLPQAVSETGSYLCTDRICISYVTETSRPKALTELNRYLVVYLAVYLTFGSTYASILA